MSQATARVERLLIELMRAPGSVTTAELDALEPAEWDALVRLAQDHRCGPYLAHVLADRRVGGLPLSLKAVRERSAVRNLTIGRECVQIHDILAGAGIAHLFLKGVALAFRDYPQPWLRPMRDIDVLVAPDRLAEAHALLVAAGGLMPAFADASIEPTPQGKHLPPIHSPNRAVAVEVHYRLVLPTVAMTPQALAFVEREIWADPGAIAIGTARLPVPAPEMLLAHLVIHALLDHELNNGPLFLTDVIHVLRSKRIDVGRWREVVAGSELEAAVELTAGMLPAAERTILTAGTECGASLPAEATRSLMLQSGKTRNQLKLHATFADAALRKRIALVLRKLFPGRAVLTARWRSEVGVLEGEPGSTLGLWCGYIGRRMRQHLAPRSDADRRTLRHLRTLRRTLGDGPRL